MRKQILVGGAIAAVTIATLVATLAALDVIAVRDLRETLGRTLLVITIITAATLVVGTLATSALRREDPKP